MAIFKPQTPRRREVRRWIGRATSPRLRLTQREVALSLLYVFALTCLGGLLAWTARARLPYRVGQTVTEPVVARVRFESIDTEKTQSNKQIAYELQPAVYQVNSGHFRSVRQNLMGLLELAHEDSIDDISLEIRQRRQLSAKGLGQLRQFLNQAKQPTEKWTILTEKLMQGLASIALLDAEDARQERDPTKLATSIRLVYPSGQEVSRADSRLFSVDDDPEALESKLERWVSRFPNGLRPSVMTILAENIQPFYVQDHEETERRRQAEADAIPPVPLIYEPNDVLVRVGTNEPHRFSKLDVELLSEERRHYQKHLGEIGQAVRVAGTVGMVWFVALALWAYFGAYYPRIIRNAMRGLAIVGLLLLGQLVAIVATTVISTIQYGPTIEQIWHFVPEFAYAGGVLPTLMVAIILTIVYDQRFALAVGAIHTLLVTFSLNLDLGFSVVLFTGVATSISQLHDVRTRAKLVRIGLWTGLLMAFAVVIVGGHAGSLYLPYEPLRVGRDALLALATGLFAGLFVQGILPAVERVFKVTTSMTLKELNDASHPLLRRLAEKAPGTYQHSLRIADMAEAAADAIGSSGLLCRVGSIYHDIGKANKPMYFVENQGHGPNRHSKLSPAMSVLIIVGHVKDGVEMAREYRLPPTLCHFIESHHGTTLVEYFYHAAKKQREAKLDKSAPSEFEFRYPGPKPQTKEAAIVMLCDSIEGAARTLVEPTPVRLEQLVHQLAMKRLMDGQFDQCNLTLQELHQIESSITKTLCAIYHGRIAYPSDQESAMTTSSAAS